MATITWPWQIYKWVRQMAGPAGIPAPRWAAPWAPTGPGGAPRHWLEEFYTDYARLRDTVMRLERVVHCNDPAGEKGNAILVTCGPGGGPSGSGSPPPPPYPPA